MGVVLCALAGPALTRPRTGRMPVDAILVDDTQRQAWRTHWHTRLGALGAEQAAGRPRAAVDFISQEDR